MNHPVKVAERVAMLDHLSEGKFEFGTRRGAGSHGIPGSWASTIPMIDNDPVHRTGHIRDAAAT